MMRFSSTYFVAKAISIADENGEDLRLISSLAIIVTVMQTTLSVADDHDQNVTQNDVLRCARIIFLCLA